MKTSKNIRCISLILLFLTVKVGAGFAAEKPGALVLAWNDANATMAACGRRPGGDPGAAPLAAAGRAD